MILAFIATFIFYFFYNKYFFDFTAHTLNCPALRPFAVILTWLFNFGIFLALSLQELPIILNWAFIGVLFVIEAKVFLRAPWIGGSLVALMGAMVGLCSTMIARSVFAIALSIPLTMVHNVNTTYKAIPIGAS